MKTVGEILRGVRKEKHLTVEDASQELKIHPRFLDALERGDYGVFSSLVHIKGFLKNYADFLGLDVPQILAFWRREYKEAGDAVPLRDATQPLKAPKVLITPGVVFSLVVFLLITAFLGYLSWQYRSIAGPPALKVTAPDKDLVVTEAVIRLEGITDPKAKLEVNGQKILVPESGKFTFDYVLAPGTNTLEFVATNEFGKETRLIRRVIYDDNRERNLMPEEGVSPGEATPAASP